MDDAGLSGEIGKFECGGRGGEIEHAFCLGKSRQGIVGDHNPVRPQTRQFTGVLAKRIRSGPFDGSSQMDAVNLGDGADQGQPHAASGANDDKAHASGWCGHGLPPLMSASVASAVVCSPSMPASL